MEAMPRAQAHRASQNSAVKNGGGKRISGILVGNTERSDDECSLEVRRRNPLHERFNHTVVSWISRREALKSRSVG